MRKKPKLESKPNRTLRPFLFVIVALVFSLLSFMVLLPAAGSAAPATKIGDFIGTWLNKDPKTRHIIRVEIPSGIAPPNSLTVDFVLHVWGACSPPCDWGTPNMRATDLIGSATYTFSFETDSLTLSLLDSNDLQIRTHTHFTDSSGRTDYSSTDLLLKSGQVTAAFTTSNPTSKTTATTTFAASSSTMKGISPASLFLPSLILSALVSALILDRMGTLKRMVRKNKADRLCSNCLRSGVKTVLPVDAEFCGECGHTVGGAS